MPKEFILCAAIWYNDGLYHEGQPAGINTGFVVCSYSHNDCFEILKILFDYKSKNRRFYWLHKLLFKHSRYDKRNATQGFLTSRKRFVNRVQAYIIHTAATGKEPFDEYTDQLYSEDLY